MLPEDFIYGRRRTAPRQPWDERLPDGRSVGELMAGIPALATAGATGPAPLGPPPPVPTFTPAPGIPSPATGPLPPATPPPVHLGAEMPTDASNLQRLMAERAALSQATPANKVTRRDWGYEIQPPEQSPSRLRHAGIGAAQGAILAGQATGGDPWGTLAGTVVGALTGGVSPALIQAFQRRQELDRNAGELGLEQKLQLQSAQIGETAAQAEQRRLEPYLKVEEMRRQDDRAAMLEEGRNARATTTNKTRVETAAEANAARKATLEETMRHNRAVEAKTPATEEITVAGRKFHVSPSTAARILEDRTKAVTKPDKERVEASAEADLETEAANDHLTKRRQAEESASVLRAERDKLSTGIGAKRNAARIDELDRQIAQAEKEASYRQKEADDAFMRARKAKAKAAAAPASGQAASGRTIEGAIDAFRKKLGREPTTEEVARMRKALGQ